MYPTANINLSEVYASSAPAAKKSYMPANLRPGLKNRFYVGLCQIICLIIVAEASKHVGTNILRGYGLYLTMLVTTVISAYTCLPLARDAFREVKNRKMGIAGVVLASVTVGYAFSIEQFIIAKGVNPLIEFSILLLVVTAGQGMVDLSKGRATAMMTAQKKQIDEILNSLDEVIWSIDANTLDVVYVNSACLQVFGYQRCEMLNDKNTFFNAIHTDDNTMFYKHLNEVMTLGSTVYEFRVHHSSGAIKYLRGEAKLLTDSQTGAKVINGITLDITNETLAEMEKQKKTAELEDVLNSINDGFFAIDGDFKLTFVNKKLRKMYNRSSEELIGKSFWEIAPAPIQKNFFNNCVLAMGSGLNVTFEDYCPHLDKWLQYKIYPRNNGAAVYFTDITKQRALLRRITDDKQKLEEQNRRLCEIAWIQSHKVRGPLANIMGLVPLLNMDNPTDEDNAFVLEGIKTASENLDGVVREISGKANSYAAVREYEKQYEYMAKNFGSF